jgi:acetyl-CoA/propionyl-CoA carboxylase biotin carboxyl carrier protein
MVTGIDLIREQIRVAAGEPLGFVQDDIRFEGFAIEGRVNAEDPANDFRPAPGTIGTYREPGGLGVRVDSAAFPGMTISPDYDSMIAKLIVWAPTRTQAIARMARAVDEFAIDGVPTTLPLLRALCDEPSVLEGDYGTATLEAFAAEHRERFAGPAAPAASPAEAGAAEEIRVEVNDRMYRVRLIDRPAGAAHASSGNGRRAAPRAAKRASAGAGGNDVLSPMHGVVIEMKIARGDLVTEGQVLAVVEAMKMMNEIRAHRSGTIATVHASAGATIEAGAPLATIA